MATMTAEQFVRLVTLTVPEAVTGLAFSSDGTLLAVAAGDKVHIFRVPPQAGGKAEGGKAEGGDPRTL